MDAPKPNLIKGHLTFRIDEQDFKFIHQNISIFGVIGLPWGTLDHHKSFGRKVSVVVHIPVSPSFQFTTTATITREASANSSYMGLRFRLDPETQTRLKALILAHGFVSTEHLRKYPRIPVEKSIRSFPLRVLVSKQIVGDEPADSIPAIAEVCNLSPNGILLSTENPNTMNWKAGTRLRVTFEPRGEFTKPIIAEALLCRIVDETNSESENAFRYLGLKFTKIENESRTEFLALLKHILTHIQAGH